MRVVSLLPSATEMLHAVGAGSELVGVTYECDHPPGVEKLPKLTSTSVDSQSMTSAEIDAAIGRLVTDGGSIYALDTGLLAELQPDLILTQGLCDVCAVSLPLVEEAAAGLPNTPRVISMNPHSIDEVLNCTVEVGEAVGRGAAARAEVAALRERLRRVEEAVSGLPRPRVAPIEWLDPPFTAGHWVPEMVRIAGGECLLAAPGDRSERTTWEAIAEADPEVLVLMPCGFDAERTVREAAALSALPFWSELAAVRSGRVWAVDASSYFSRPAPRLVDGVEVLARLIHPEAFPDAPEPGTVVRLAPAARV
jgi:iron complex transport system substrate-binding protein